MTCTGTTSYSTKLDPAAAALGLSRQRIDMSVGLSYAATDTIALFGSMGRTLSHQDANAGTVVISGGASLGFSAWRPHTRR
jgi:spore coat protein U-like protein